MNNYFPHPSNLRDDDAVLALRMKEGAAGYGVYVMLLELMRDTENQSLSFSACRLAYAIHEADAGLVNRVINDYGLFEVHGGETITSPFLSNAMSVYEDAKARASEAARKAAAARWHKNDAKPMQSNAEAMQAHASELQGNANKPNQGDISKETNSNKSKLKDLTWKDWSGVDLVNLARQTSMAITQSNIDLARDLGDDSHNRACVLECARDMGCTYDVAAFLDQWTDSGLVGSKNLMYLIKLRDYLKKGDFKPKYINDYVLTSCLTYREL